MKARKIIICVLAAVVLSSIAFAQKSGRYVNSREGLNIRAEPNAGAAKVGARNVIQRGKGAKDEKDISDFCGGGRVVVVRVLQRQAV